MTSCIVKTIHKWVTSTNLHIREGSVTVHQVVRICEHCTEVRTIEERYRTVT